MPLIRGKATATRAVPPAIGRQAATIARSSATAQFMRQSGSGFLGRFTGRMSRFFGSLQAKLFTFGLLAAVGNIISKLGSSKFIKKNNSIDSTVGKFLRGTGKVMSAPHAVSGMTMHEIATSTKAADMAETHLGTGARRLTENVQATIAMAGDSVISAVGSILKTADEYAKFSGRLDKNIAKQQKKIEKLATRASQQHDTSQNILHLVGDKLLGRNTNISPEEAKRRLKPIVNKLNDAAEQPNHKAAAATVDEALKELQTVSAMPGSYKRSITRYANAILDKTEKQQKRSFWDNPKQAIADKTRDMTVSEMVVGATTVLHHAYRLHDAYGQWGGNIRGLKLLMADLSNTQANKISTWKALFGKTSNPLIKRARAQIWKKVVPNIGITLLTTIGYGYIKKATRKIVSNRNTVTHGIVSNMVYMGLNTLGDKLQGSDNLLDIYVAAKVAEETNNKITPDQYMAMIVETHPNLEYKLQQSGATAGMLATAFAMRNASTAEVLQELSKGEQHLMNLVFQVDDEIWNYYSPDTPRKGSAAASRGAASTIAASHHSQNKSWVDKTSRPVQSQQGSTNLRTANGTQRSFVEAVRSGANHSRAGAAAIS